MQDEAEQLFSQAKKHSCGRLPPSVCDPLSVTHTLSLAFAVYLSLHAQIQTVKTTGDRKS